MMEMVGGSFRDPSGVVYADGEKVIRKIEASYKANYETLMDSGLYQSLVNDSLLVSHIEADGTAFGIENAYKIIAPERMPFVSYPYEWCFSQLKDAALATLSICRIAIEHGMILKDASAYNIQFHKSRPVLIDTLSFMQYRLGEPWGAYRQFCEHFLLPLAAMAHGNLTANRLLQLHIDGIPLEAATSFLPARAWLNPWLALHLLAHGRMQQKFGDTSEDANNPRKTLVSKQSVLGLLDNLETTVKALELHEKRTEWSDYYNDTNYTSDGLAHKKELIASILDKAQPKTVWDLGGNVGMFSRVATERGMHTVCIDIDPLCVEHNYLIARAEGNLHLLPLCIDLAAPSPSIGWANRERQSLVERGPADMLMALGLVHHLVIRNNVPLSSIAKHFAELAKNAVVEWIPKTDSQVKRIAKNRWDELHEYSEAVFEAAVKEYYEVLSRDQIRDSQRVLYVLRRREK